MRALVLLSGGLDSAVALDWAAREFREVRALSFDYGQPHRNELASAQLLARRRGIPWDRYHLAEAVRGMGTLAVPPAGADNGVSRANLPARNAIMLSIAAAHAARTWPGNAVSLVIGSTADDAAFPDCSLPFMSAMGLALSAALSGVVPSVTVRSPWVERAATKADVIRYAERTGSLDAARLSISCYAGTRCGGCDACTLRSRSFADVGVVDGDYVPASIGGDPGRDRK